VKNQASGAQKFAFAVSACADAQALFNFALSGCGGTEWERGLPELVKMRHGNPPMRDRALGIAVRDVPKRVFGGNVGEGVEQGYASIEPRLHIGFAGNPKRHFAQTLANVGIGHVLGGGKNGTQKHHERQELSQITKHLCLSPGSEIYEAGATSLILD
jgi:hypothetical protein